MRVVVLRLNNKLRRLVCPFIHTSSVPMIGSRVSPRNILEAAAVAVCRSYLSQGYCLWCFAPSKAYTPLPWSQLLSVRSDSRWGEGKSKTRSVMFLTIIASYELGCINWVVNSKSLFAEQNVQVIPDRIDRMIPDSGIQREKTKKQSFVRNMMVQYDWRRTFLEKVRCPATYLQYIKIGRRQD